MDVVVFENENLPTICKNLGVLSGRDYTWFSRIGDDGHFGDLVAIDLRVRRAITLLSASAQNRPKRKDPEYHATYAHHEKNVRPESNPV